MSSGGCRNLSWSAWSRCSSPMRMIRAPFGPCPGEDGKSPGRTSPCGGAVYLLDEADIVICERHARGSALETIDASPRPLIRLGYDRHHRFDFAFEAAPLIGTRIGDGGLRER